MVSFDFPCDIGDCVYMVMDDMPLPAVREVRSIRISKDWKDEYDIRFSVMNMRTREITSFRIDDINKTVFANKEEAMKAIENNT